ncbi:MAG: DinB family protein [Anaerolineae bacterium]
MASKPLTVEEILTMLTAAPPRIASLTADLTPAQLRAAPSPGEWSANEVLAHLRSCADVWGGCIGVILAQDRPTIRAVDPRTWLEQTDYLDQEFAASLRAFTTQRAELLAVLESLAPEDWSRSATVTGAGGPLVRTVQSYAAWLARHERPHVKQIESISRVSRPAEVRGISG